MADEINVDAILQPAAITEPTPAPVADEVKLGVQKRIDELTAEKHDARRQTAALQEQNAQLLQLIAAGQQHHEVTQAPIEIDPEEMKKLDYIIGRATKPLQEEIKALRSTVARSSQVQAASGLEMELREINNPEITARVQQLLGAWTQAGLLQAGTVVPQDALDIAMGQAAMKERKARQPNRDERANFNQHGAPLAGQGAAGGKVASAGPDISNIDPTTLNDVQLTKYLELLEKKLGGT